MGKCCVTQVIEVQEICVYFDKAVAEAVQIHEKKYGKPEIAYVLVKGGKTRVYIPRQ